MLRLLDKYPTAERIAPAHRASLEKIPYLSAEQAQALHLAAEQSVASPARRRGRGPGPRLVTQVRHCQKAEKDLRQLLTAAFAELPASPHVQVVTIPGIGEATAAVLVAKIVDIDRFATPDQVVSYFGIFPEENSSGVDKQGNPLPPGTLHMSPQRQRSGARATSGMPPGPPSATTPPSAPSIAASGPKGKRGDVAIGHCMRKLLHLVFAVWKTDRPFDPKHFPWETSGEAASSTTTPAGQLAPMQRSSVNEKAVGHKRDLPAREVVTTAASTVEPALLRSSVEAGDSSAQGRLRILA